MKTRLLLTLLIVFSIKISASDKERDSLSVAKKSPNLIAELSAYNGVIKDVATSHLYNANHFTTYYTMSKRFYTKKDFKNAILEFDGRIKDNRFDSNNYFLRGLSKDLIKDYEGAIKDFTWAISLNPSSSNFYFHRGFSKMGLRADIDAKRDFTNAIELDPNYADAYFFRGIINLRLKNNEDSRKDLIKAMELGNNEASAYITRFLN